MNPLELEAKVALVTGAGQGVGADIARGLASRGAHVIVLDMNGESSAAVAAEIGEPAVACQADVTDDEQLDRAVALAISRFGRLDIVVNNACAYADRGIASTRAEWLHTLNVNLVSAAMLAQKAAPRLPRGGVIVNMGSTGGKFGAAGRALYPASKAALMQLTRSLAAELAPAGVRVVTVSPAWTWSPAVESFSGGDRALADEVAGQFHPLGRVGRGSEVAAAVAFVCSDAASWITGIDLPVDGGFSMLGPDRGIAPRAWFQAARTAADAARDKPEPAGQGGPT